MPIIKYEDLLSKNERNMGFNGLNSGSVKDLIHKEHLPDASRRKEQRSCPGNQYST
jgi:hypothetical protein